MGKRKESEIYDATGHLKGWITKDGGEIHGATTEGGIEDFVMTIIGIIGAFGFLVLGIFLILPGISWFFLAYQISSGVMPLLPLGGSFFSPGEWQLIFIGAGISYFVALIVSYLGLESKSQSLVTAIPTFIVISVYLILVLVNIFWPQGAEWARVPANAELLFQLLLFLSYALNIFTILGIAQIIKNKK
jgi:hypothetical protein